MANKDNKKVRSMRGEIVDFDLLEMKAQMESAPATEDIVQRERFVTASRKRGTKRKIQEMLAQQAINQNAVRAALEKQNKLNSEPAEQEIKDTQQENTLETQPRKIIRKDK